MQILTDKRKTERGQPLSAPIGIVPAGESAYPVGLILSPPFSVRIRAVPAGNGGCRGGLEEI